MQVRNKKTLITVVGPTAIGKTRMAIALAQHFGTEIISCDSRQFYKEMTVGTAVPTADELAMARHHFIQHKSVTEVYTVGDFEREALAKLNELFGKHEVVIMVGGSGLYVNAVLYGLDDFPEVPDTIRQELNARYEAEGIAFLQKQLRELDRLQYTQMDTNNPQRMIRALEVCFASGRPYSSFLKKKEISRDFDPIVIGLTAEREEVYQRINDRVEQMLENGLLIEAQNLFHYRHLNALQTVGYQELFAFFERKMSLAEAVEEIKKNTRRFAKRQYTWFNKNKEIQWFSYTTEVADLLKNSSIYGKHF